YRVLAFIHGLDRLGIERLESGVDVTTACLRHQLDRRLIFQNIKRKRTAPGLLERYQCLAQLAQIFHAPAEIIIEKNEPVFDETEVVVVPLHLEFDLVDDVLDRPVAVCFPSGKHTEIASEGTTT